MDSACHTHKTSLETRLIDLLYASALETPLGERSRRSQKRSSFGGPQGMTCESQRIIQVPGFAEACFWAENPNSITSTTGNTSDIMYRRAIGLCFSDSSSC